MAPSKRLIVLTLVLVFCLSSPTDAEPTLRTVTLQLRWDHQFQFAGYYAALWQGYYAEEGLDVDIRSALASGQLESSLAAVAEGRAEFGIGGADVLVERDQGRYLVVLATIFQRSAARFYYLPDRPVESLADFTRLRVVRRTGDLVDIELQALLAAEGIDPKEVASFQHDISQGYFHQLIENQVDIVPGYSIGSPHEAMQQGMALRFVTPSTYGVDFYGDALVTRGELARAEPDMVERFRRASLRGWSYALEHPEEIAERIIASKQPAFPLDDWPGFVRFQIAPVTELTLYPLVEPGHTNPLRWRQMHGLLRRAGVVTDEFDPSMIYSPQAQRPGWLSEHVDLVMAAGISGLVVLSLSVCWGFLMRHRAGQKHIQLIRREADLAEASERLRQTIRAGQVGLWDWDLETNKVQYSPEWKQQIGYGEEEISDEFDEWERRVHPADLEPTLKVLLPAIEEARDNFEVEFRFRHKDGSYRWILAHGSVRVNAEGKPIRVRGSHIDITDRNAAEDQRKRELAFSRALNTIAEAIIAHEDAEQVMEVSNRVLGETLQVDRTLIYDISFEQDRLIGKCEWLGQKHPLITATKDAYPLEMFRAPLCYIRETRHPLVSRRDAVAEPFRLDGSGDMLHGHFNIKSLIWYPFAFDTHGFHLFTINQILEDRCWTQQEIDFIDSAARMVSIALMKIRLVDDRNRAQREQETLQAHLMQAQKMDSVGRLAGGVAHDFNNMLNVILGYAEILLTDMPAESDLRNSLEEIHKAAERSAALTRQLLAFARKQAVNPRVLDLNQTIESMLTMFRRLIGENIRLRWLPGEHLASVRIDPAQLDQVLANLIVNARDAIDGIGTVTIETSRYECEHTPQATDDGCGPGTYVRLTLRDTGCGMDDATLERVFEPFFTTKGVGQGTGLGLSTVYGIVKQNDGFIEVHSTPGKGTTFHICLPEHKEPVERATAERTPTDARGSETVLLVEDEPSILSLVTILLKRLGYSVLAAPGPMEALRLAEQCADRIHLVVTDVIMPEMNGRDLMERLSALHPNAKCLYMSGHTANVIGFDDAMGKGLYFIQKPFSGEALARKVREVLRGELDSTDEMQ